MNSEMYEENADNKYKFEISTLDQFKNIVDSSESEIDLEIVGPNDSKQYKYETTENPKTNALTYTVESRIAGEYSISSGLFENNTTYKFNVIPGECNKLQTQIQVEPVILNAGDLAFANIAPFDQYGNSINVMREDVLDAYHLVQIFDQSSNLTLTPIQSNNTL
jgi:hypothetical protein